MGHHYVLVSDLYVQCALKMRHLNDPATAMSDCCRLPASTAVEMENGRKMWRCTFHAGVRDYVTGEMGPIFYGIIRSK